MHKGKNDFNEHVAQNIRKCRKRAGFTQQAAADAVFCSLTTYQKFESGICSPDLNMISLLTQAFEVTMNELLSGFLSAPFIYPASLPSGKKYDPLGIDSTADKSGEIITLLLEDRKILLQLLSKFSY